MIQKLNIHNIEAIFFDFDGVLTNNMVYLNQDGLEMVRCNRSDGLAFDILRYINKPVYIISTESNPIVSVRAKKLKVPVSQSVDDKLKEIKRVCRANNYNKNSVLFIGNDINDYSVMDYCGLSACPNDSDKKIKEIATIIFKKNGGDGVVMELISEVFKIDCVEILNKKKERK